ncbi:MAG TPA: hypothetical protein VLV89_06260 [Candidatus Acidoferrum sp.]|nr:hypothetical protein [Candidatus Acidoferrum sp.]
MRARFLMAAGLAFLLVSAAGAQTKFSGKLTCAKPDPNYSVDVGDKPGHSYTMEKDSCTWDSATLINGMKVVSDSGASTGEAWATKVTSSGSRIATMENGDKLFASVHDSSPVKDGMPTDIEGTWTFTGGTGKLKGIKGHGTYKVTPAPDGSASVTVEGEYTVAPPPPAKAPAPKPAK